MAGWQGGRVAGWQGGRVAGWQGGRVAGWQGGRVAGWQGGRVAGWQGGRVAGGRWQGGREARVEGWQDGRVDGRLTSIKHPRSSSSILGLTFMWIMSFDGWKILASSSPRESTAAYRPNTETHKVTKIISASQIYVAKKEKRT